MGRPKAWLPFGPEFLLQRVVRLVSRAVGPTAVVAAQGQDLPPLPKEVILVRDEASGRGPLQGLAAGLEALTGRAELVFATATDVPFLQPAWIGRLAELLGESDLSIPYIGGYFHPLASLYRQSAALPAAKALLMAERLRPVFLMERLRTVVVVSDELRTVDHSFLTLRNLNTPEDYAAALADEPGSAHWGGFVGGRGSGL
jgi:molybdopterin-guanine dinucleotide biosynthesis protein A